MSAWEASRGSSDEYMTPAHVFKAMAPIAFDLDPAAPPEGPRHVPLAPGGRWYCEADDSLAQPWLGFVWLNPPFEHNRGKLRWLGKFFDHGNGIALMPDRTSAPWARRFMPLADHLLFVAPKIKFERPDGSVAAQPGTGTMLMAVGPRGSAALHRAAHACLGTLLMPANHGVRMRLTTTT